MKFMDSMFDCGFKECYGKPLFASIKFWVRAFENDKKIVVLLSKVQNINPFKFDNMSDVLANKFFYDLEVDLEDFFWIEHFPEIVGQSEKRERFLNVEYWNSGTKLERVDEHRVFFEQIECAVGEELKSIRAISRKRNKKIILRLLSDF